MYSPSGHLLYCCRCGVAGTPLAWRGHTNTRRGRTQVDNSVDQQDYYAVLGVDRKATSAEIKAAYLQLARQYHPDKNTGTTALGTRFQALTEAYKVLSDPNRRAAYDVARNTAKAWGSKPPPQPPGGSPSHPYWTTPRTAQQPPKPPPGMQGQQAGPGVATAAPTAGQAGTGIKSPPPSTQSPISSICSGVRA